MSNKVLNKMIQNYPDVFHDLILDGSLLNRGIYYCSNQYQTGGMLIHLEKGIYQVSSSCDLINNNWNNKTIITKVR